MSPPMSHPLPVTFAESIWIVDASRMPWVPLPLAHKERLRVYSLTASKLQN
jgi:hypothetical protein